MIFKQDESRRAFVYGPIQDGAHFPQDVEGIKVIGEAVRFSKANFPTSGDCEKWLRENAGEDVLQVKSFVATNSALVVDDNEWGRMVPFITNPDGVQRDDFKVYRSWLANNVIDRDGQRFPVKMLGQFAATIPGKSKMFNHDWFEGKPEGRYYTAELVKVTHEEMLRRCGPNARKDFADLVKEAENIDGGLYWLVASFFVSARDAELVFKIDSGIYSQESIGFRAPTVVPHEKDGKVLWYDWVDEGAKTGEATEGSWVFLGAQYGARTGKSAGDNIFTSLGKAFAISEIESIVEAALNSQLNKAGKEQRKMIKVKIAGADYELDQEKPESVQGMVQDVEAKISGFQEAKQEAENLREQVATMKKVFDAAGFTQETNEEHAKAIVQDAEAFRETVIAQTMKFGQLTGAIPQDETEAKAHRDSMVKLGTSEIARMGDGYKAIWEKANPPESQIKQDGKASEEKGKGANGENPTASVFGMPY